MKRREQKSFYVKVKSILSLRTEVINFISYFKIKNKLTEIILLSVKDDTQSFVLTSWLFLLPHCSKTHKVFLSQAAANWKQTEIQSRQEAKYATVSHMF